METSVNGLRRLLAVELPLDGVGPAQRDAVRRALRAGEEPRLRAVARAVVGELLRSGRLLRVAVEGQRPGPGGPFVFVPGQTRLIDLSCLGGLGGMGGMGGLGGLGSEGAWAGPGPAGGPAQPTGPTPAPGVDELLGAMEFAQDLEVADLRMADKGSILAGVLRLVGRFVPQFELHLQLPAGEAAPDDPDHVFVLDAAAADSGWQPLRPSGHAVWIPMPAELPSPVRRRHEARCGRPVACGVAVPLWEPGEPATEAGLLFVTASTDWGREALLRLAERLSRFVTRRWQSQREVNLRIHKDGLTGVFNRAYFDSQFPLELERARRSGGPLTLVITDLDHFKAINDRYGHPAGDRILKMMARRWQDALRRIDHVCRIGGEEFALILTDTPPEAAHEVVGRLLDSDYFETVEQDGQSQQLRVTFSAGAITFPAGGTDPMELYRKADHVLYVSKDLGRDQCHFWDSEGQHLKLTPHGR